MILISRVIRTSNLYTYTSLLKIFINSITAQSGVVLLPAYDGSWMNCTSDIATAAYQSFSIKIVDYSTPVTPGFGTYMNGNSSNERIQGIGVSVYSMITSSILPNTTTDLKKIQISENLVYCGSMAVPVTQCDSPFMGLPSPNQTDQTWCLFISNQFNNSQKAYVSLTPYNTSKNVNNSDKSVSGMAKNINNEHLLLILLILFQMLWEYFC
ncbi:hypothetical protein C2G38_2167040 [Gigaspora rosea]|uniref:Uncharacterized protein n=1 Tax=Gigaspora rosea TaxID=44941 RepID=A0A397VUE7_9GLOM|nr:hypothetical protein C2G38_2167040 [Gigaspora rosea]